MKPITLYGAGGHAFAVVELIRSLGIYEPTVIIDKDTTIKEVLGVKVVAPEKYDDPEYLCLSLGKNNIRKRLADRCNSKYPVFIHKTAVVYPSASISEGSIVLPGAVIDADVQIGRHCIVNNNATVSHNARIADFVHIAINAAVTGLVTIGEGSLIGAGSIILPKVTIGKWAVVGAGTVVTTDVPDYAVVVGNPARIIRINQPEN